MNLPIIEMQSEYPFGAVEQNVEECTQMVVHKELPFSSPK